MMFVYILVSVWLVSASLIASPAETENQEPVSKYIELDNGLKIVLLKRDSLPLVNMVCAVDVGSKNERVETSGLVHLLEHLVLLGQSQSYSGDEANLAMRRHGAYFNAHTNHDFMTFEISLPAEFVSFGLGMMKEKVFALKLSKAGLEKEKKIIFEEMAQNKDMSYTRGVLLALENLFKGHPYEQPLSGTAASIEKATIEVLNGFYNKYVVPSNCSMAIVGDIDIAAVEKNIRALFTGLVNGPETLQPGNFPKAVPLEKKIRVSETMDINQARLIIGFQAPHSGHEDQLAVEVFNQIVGKGINPLLGQMMIRRGRRLTYGIVTRYIPLQYGGAYLVFITVEPKHLKAVERNVLKFLNKTAWNFSYSADDYIGAAQFQITDYLVTAKNTIKYNYQRFQELGLNSATAYAAYNLYRGKAAQEVETPPYLERLDKVTSNDIRRSVSEHFSGKNYVVITLLPEKKK